MRRSVTKIPSQLLTIQDWVSWGERQFRKAKLYFGHGTDNARDEATYLVLHVLHLPLGLPTQKWRKPLSVMQCQRIFALLQQRIETRKPAAYLTHEAWFAGLSFMVDERVLIPRSPLAEFIVNRFSPWIASHKVKHILDLCTGSGCIAVTCAKVFPRAKVVATDISTDALAVAKKNVAKYRLQKRVTIVQSDLFQQLGKQKFDVIITNPPYVDAQDMRDLPKEYRHEPRLALAAGRDGLTIVKKILAQAKAHLTKSGVLIVEVGNSAKALMQQFPMIPFTWLVFTQGESEVFLLSREQLG